MKINVRENLANMQTLVVWRYFCFSYLQQLASFGLTNHTSFNFAVGGGDEHRGVQAGLQQAHPLLRVAEDDQH